MEEKQETSTGFEQMVNAWGETMQQVMTTMPNWWSMFQSPQTTSEKQQTNTSFESMATAFKSWQTLVSAMSTPESMASIFKGSEALPDMAAQFGQAIFESLSELQKRIGQSATSLGQSVEAYGFDQLDENLLHVWTDIYEREFKKFFHVPQLGLTREYQERFNDMLDKFNQYQTTQAEFLRMLSMPFHRSMTVMQEKVAQMAEEGELPDDSGVYYQMWIKILEGHFMTLFQTPEYVQALAKTISSLSSFSTAKDRVLEDLIKGLPIARRSDMDDLAKEVYELKKRIRRLEKKEAK